MENIIYSNKSKIDGNWVRDVIWSINILYNANIGAYHIILMREVCGYVFE